MNKPAKKPVRFSRKIFLDMCNRLAIGGSKSSLASVCDSEDMPAVSTIFEWLDKSDRAIEEEDPYFGLGEIYARAVEARKMMIEREIVEISDDSSQDEIVDEEGNVRENREFVNRSRLRVESRKWIMSKMDPKNKGRRVIHNFGNDTNGNVIVSQGEGAVQNGSTGFVINMINSPDDSGNGVR